MKRVAGLLAAGFFLCSNAAFATQVDLQSWTCKQFLSAGRDEIGMILAWLDGYYMDQDDPPIIDTDRFVANSKRLTDYCAAHPDDSLVTATDKLFKKGD